MLKTIFTNPAPHHMKLTGIIGFICTAAIACAAGIFTTTIKNESVQVCRGSNFIDEQITSCQKDIEFYQYKCSTELSYFNVKERLAQHHTAFQTASPEQIRYVPRTPQSGMTMVTTP